MIKGEGDIIDERNYKKVNPVRIKKHRSHNLCRGCNRLRPCSEAKDCQLYNDEVTQPRNKTLKKF